VIRNLIVIESTNSSWVFKFEGQEFSGIVFVI